MKNTRKQSFILSIVTIFLFTPLVGSMLPLANQTSYPITVSIPHKQKQFIDFTEEIFLYVIQQTEATKVANLLWHSYQEAKKQDALNFINPCVLDKVCNLICTTQYAKGNFERALEFAEKTNDILTQGRCHKKLALQAHAELRFADKERHYEEAFKLFGECRLGSGKKYYEYALWHGQGWEYDKSIVAKYYLEQLQCSYSPKQVTHAIKKLVQLNPNDTNLYCTLAKKYLDLSAYDKSLEFFEKAIISFANIPIQGIVPQQYNLGFQVALGRLSFAVAKISNDLIAQKANDLLAYFNILLALRNGNHEIIKELGAQYKENISLKSAPLQLLCSCINSATVIRIKNLTFDDAEFIEFCSSEEELAIEALKFALCHMPIDSQTKDLFHILIGGYEYHKNNFGAAAAQFEQCSTYKSDLYLQALSLKIAAPESRQEIIVSMLPLLEKSLNSTKKNARNEKAKATIAQLCGYDPAAQTEYILDTGEKLIPIIAVSKKAEKPLEYAYILLALHDLYKKGSMLSPDQQKITTTLLNYFTFFSALQESDQKKLDDFFKKNIQLSKIERIVMQALRKDTKNAVLDIIFETEDFVKFCESILIDILAHTTEHPNQQFKIKPAHCHYILGGYELLKQNYDVALKHLLQCDNNDLYVQAERIKATPVENILEILQACIPLFKQAKNDRTEHAKNLINTIITCTYQTYIASLLENQEYEKAYAFTHCLVQLGLPTSNVLCNAFMQVEERILETPQETYHALLTIPSRIHTYNAIKKIADQKNHNGYWCGLLSFLQLQHLNYPHENQSDTIKLAEECFHYLSCSLQHDNEVGFENEIDHRKQTRLILYGKLACQLGIIKKSPELFRLAINCGNEEALYRYADLLSKPSQKKQKRGGLSSDIVELLEKHVVSNDDAQRRVLSYKALALHHYSLMEYVEHKKKAFEYLKAAAALNDYELGYMLALFYTHGIPGHLEPDYEQALDCLNRIIALKNDNYIDALYIRAAEIYYKQSKFDLVIEDLQKIIDCPAYNGTQKFFSYWLMGITHLHTNAALTEYAIECLQKGYVLGSEHQSVNPRMPSIKLFQLSDNPKTMNIVEEKIAAILDNKKTDILSVEFCTIIGAALFVQRETQPITDHYRKLAVTALCYAAQNNNAEAPFILLQTDEKEVSFCDRIYYLVLARKNNPKFTQGINDILTKKLLHTDVFNQGVVLLDLAKKNDSAFQEFISHLYEYNSPIVIDPVSYKIFSHKTIQPVIEQCLQIQPLVQAADAFLKNGIKSTPLEHSAAIFLGSLFTYSTEQQLLLKGATYLETARKYFTLIQNKHIRINLSHIYYKLSQLQLESKNMTMFKLYLKKSEELSKQ